MLSFLGYTATESGTNPTGFFEYTAEEIANLEANVAEDSYSKVGFQASNQQMISWLSSLTASELESMSWPMTIPIEQQVQLIDVDIGGKFSLPLNHYA